MPENRPSRPTATWFAGITPRDAGGVAAAVAELLQAAVDSRASDLHLLPTQAGLEISWRLDGVMQSLGTWPAGVAANVIGRLKVLAELLTYRTDLPQEGRLRTGTTSVEMRLSTFPTLHGEKGVIRLFIGAGAYQTLDDLGLPPAIRQQLRRQLEETTGCLVFAGPAGSGKTTSAYACLREILRFRQSGKSIATLEDPIEAEIAGVSQSQVNRPKEFTYGLGLRSLMRQDPDVILVGEIRDRETAETVFQASLTGHLVLTTLHAGSAAQGVTRLRDLGVEPYLLRAGLRGILCQRLLRQICNCRRASPSSPGCEACWHTGYFGRFLISELMAPELLPESLAELGVLSADLLQQRAQAAGMVPLRQGAALEVAAGRTTAAEVLRVLGTGAAEEN
ncbi:MAG: GspE/PulE family protein [Planctomycetaceae bacterium]|nr:GspE/PulE family protein [Planctomycetaceae bacterium]